MILSEYYRWLKKDWAKVGFILSIFLFVFLFVFVRKNDFVIFILLLQTPLYMLHQTEEYVFPGGFGKFFNTKILPGCGSAWNNPISKIIFSVARAPLRAIIFRSRSLRWEKSISEILTPSMYYIVKILLVV